MRVKFDQIWQTVAQDLKEAIIKGELSPGDRLKVNELAEHYGVSNTPIREAFRYLASHDFVENIPRKMVVVKGLSINEIEDIYAIQIELEGLAARLAARNCSPENLARLEENVRQMTAYYQQGEMDHYMTANAEFHELFTAFSGNRRLIRLIANTRDHINRFRYLILRYPDKPHESLKQHQRIFDALKKGDAETCGKEVRRHVRGGFETMQKILKDTHHKIST
jgi:DNA-binding GntR family transcriptional regulator